MWKNPEQGFGWWARMPATTFTAAIPLSMPPKVGTSQRHMLGLNRIDFNALLFARPADARRTVYPASSITLVAPGGKASPQTLSPADRIETQFHIQPPV
jgi:hypothetical protein